MSGETSNALLTPEAWHSLSISHARHPVVADANALFQDTLRHAVDGFTAMTFLAEHGPVALLSLDHVPSRAQERLPQMAVHAGISEELVMKTWRTVHEPLTRFVAVPRSLCAKDPRVAAVSDSEDIPFAQLAVAVGPSMLLSRDHHLHDAGLGTERWVEALLILGNLIELELVFYGTAKLALACGYLLSRSAAEGMRLLLRSPAALGLTLGASGFLLSQDRENLGQRAKSLMQTLGNAGGRALDLAAPHFERHREAQAHLHTKLIAPMEPIPPEAICARELAICRGSLGAPNLLSTLRRAGYHYAQADLEGMLAAYPLFTPADAEEWTLGSQRTSPKKAGP